VEAAGNYVRLHTNREEHLLRETLNELESRLDSSRFVRVHRSSIVNIDSIKELAPAFHGDLQITLRNGTRLTLSRTYRSKLESLLGDRL
jgi:two-component system LytT family response regulator